MKDPTVSEFRSALKAMSSEELAELTRRMKTKTALLLEELLVLQEHAARRNQAMHSPPLFGMSNDHTAQFN